MKKIIFLMPVYNDWESLEILLKEINEVILNINNFSFECIVVNDCSTVEKLRMVKPKSFDSLEILNMSSNRGHARCNASGLRYIQSNKSFDYIIVMDSDGEDRPVEIKDMILKISQDPEVSVVAKRVKRSEGIIFKSLYSIHKLITHIFTGKKINFGNYSCLTKKDVETLCGKSSLWNSFSGSIKKHLFKLNEVDSTRGLRYLGLSKMSLFSLIIHSLSIIAVFKYTVLLRSSFVFIGLFFISGISNTLILSIQILILIFNLIIIALSSREDKKSLLASNKNILNVEKILH
mgnify:FL=1|tara:strand:- start:916 stop:1788 length:873 start_codon:yes stop_codon:yes gene_type:complete